MVWKDGWSEVGDDMIIVVAAVLQSHYIWRMLPRAAIGKRTLIWHYIGERHPKMFRSAKVSWRGSDCGMEAEWGRKDDSPGNVSGEIPSLFELVFSFVMVVVSS